MPYSFPYLRTSLEKKQWMALSGFFLSLFLLSHMLANLLVLFSPEAYNKYSHTLTSSPLIYLAEVFLAFIFLLHIFLAICITIDNRKSRSSSYHVEPQTKEEGAASMAVRSMIYTGLLVFVFLISHLITFKFGPWYVTDLDGEEMRDLYALVLEVFENPYYVLWYVFSMLVLALHLSHAIQSMFQSFGFKHSRLSSALKLFSFCFTVLVSLGFLSVPLYVFFMDKL